MPTPTQVKTPIGPGTIIEAWLAAGITSLSLLQFYRHRQRASVEGLALCKLLAFHVVPSSHLNAANLLATANQSGRKANGGVNQA